MLRSRCQRLKLVIILVSLCILMSYFVRNPSKSFEDDEDGDEKGKRRFSQDLFGNISGEFALDVLEAEVRDDMKWLRAETSDLVVPTSSDAFRTRSNKPPYRKLKPNDQTYLIVEYTNVFFKPKFCDKTSEEIFNSPIERCEYQNCVYSCAKSDQNVIKNADALLFHQRDIEAEFELKYGSNLQSWLSATSQLPFKTASEKLANNPEQVWVLWNDEATWVDTKLDSISNLFNWTLSFRTGSEIHKGSYGFLKPTSRKKIDEFAHKKREVYTNEFLRRKNAIVWFVSNCKAQARLNLALEISKLYPVYIFGRCSQSLGDSESSYAHLHIIKDSCASGSECEREQLESFKYYLAFENTNCSDYVTEKVWRSLGKSIIPIVLQPARDSYARYRLPSKSIIHMQDFDNSPKRLVDYLNRIDASFPLYYEHLKWTSVYTKAYFTAQYIEPLRMCQFCRMLNTYEPVVYYNKIASFFNNQCYT